jgi:hypothetical protein
LAQEHGHRDSEPFWTFSAVFLGLIGLTLVVPVLLFLGLGWGSAERSLLVLGPMSTFALPLIAMIAFWWEDWPGTMLRAPLAGLADTVLVAMGGVLLSCARCPDTAPPAQMGA